MKQNSGTAGFTLIELVVVTLMVAILAAVAIPNFIDFRTDARNAATSGALGGFRSAIMISRAAIALREDPSAPPYPTAVEVEGNAFNASHPILSGKKIMDPAFGIPVNPWSLSTIPVTQQNSVFDCTGMTKSFILSTAGNQQYGWCYDGSQGMFWANSTRNGGVAGATENNY